MLQVMEYGEAVVRRADGATGLNLWPPLCGLLPPAQLGVQGEEGQDEGGHQVGQVPHKEDHTCHGPEDVLL